MNLPWTVSDIRRRLSRIISVGVISVRQGARASVNIDGYITDLLLVIQPRAGDAGSNHFPEAGEEVVVLSPGGDINQGIILPSINNSTYPAVSTDTHRTEYPDGSFVEFDPASGNLSVSAEGNVDVDAVGNLTANVDGNVAVTATNASVVATGTCDVTSTGNMSLTAPVIALNGAVTITGVLSAQGGIAATGDVTADGTSLQNHTHPGDSGGTTGAPN